MFSRNSTGKETIEITIEAAPCPALILALNYSKRFVVVRGSHKFDRVFDEDSLKLSLISIQ